MYKCNRCECLKPADKMVKVSGTVTPRCKQCRQTLKLERNRLKKIGEYVNSLSLEQRQKTFLAKAVEAHGDVYCYDRTDYQGAHADVEIYCTRHNGYFFQSPTAHISGSGCYECGLKVTASKRKRTTEGFIEKAVGVHGSKYTYLNTEYKGCNVKVAVTCNVHGDFNILADSHLQGRGCGKCAKNGYNTGKPGKLYVLQLGDIVKVGITNFCVKGRAAHISRGMPEKFRVVKSWEWDDGSIANDIETTLLRHLRMNFQSPVERFHGWTECFIGIGVDDLLELIDAEVAAN